MKSQRKKKPVPLHVSLARIHAERANVIRRTNNRIALLNAAAQEDQIPLLPDKKNWHCCLNTICFSVLLLLLNLLFLQWQWLYYQRVFLYKL
jgi:hypothetical protein